MDMCESVREMNEIQNGAWWAVLIRSIIFLNTLSNCAASLFQILEDWRYIAMVIDRLMLYIFLAVTLGGTVGILINAPHIFDYIDQDEVIKNEIMGSTNSLSWAPLATVLLLLPPCSSILDHMIICWCFHWLAAIAMAAVWSAAQTMTAPAHQTTQHSKHAQDIVIHSAATEGATTSKRCRVAPPSVHYWHQCREF